MKITTLSYILIPVFCLFVCLCVRLKEVVAYFYCLFWRQCTVKVNLHYIWHQKYIYTCNGRLLRQIRLKEDVTLFFYVVNKKNQTGHNNRILFGKYWLQVWDLYNLICYYWYWLLFDIDLLIVIWCWFVIIRILYTFHFIWKFYLTSKVYLHYARGAFSLWSKDAGVLNDVVAHKRWGGGEMTLRGVSYIIYDYNKPLSSCERRGTNS